MKKLNELDDLKINKNSEIDFQIDSEHIDINIITWENDEMIIDEMMYTGKYTIENEEKAEIIVQELEDDLKAYKLDLEQGNI